MEPSRKKAFRITLRIAGIILSLLLLCWLIVAAYIFSHKQDLIKKARTEINDKLGGDATIGDIDVSLFRHFPEVSLHLSRVSLRDSLWYIHHHDLCQAENIFVRFSLFSIFSGHPKISKVFLHQGSIYLYTDSTGYGNDYLLHKRIPQAPNNAPEKEDKEAAFPDIYLSDFRFVMEKLDKHKLFDLAIRKLDCRPEPDHRALSFRIDMETQVHSFSFNTEKGSFLKNAILSGNFSLAYNRASRILQVPDITLHINDHPFQLSGRFFPDVTPLPFILTIQTSGILYRKLTAFMTPALQQKLDQYDIDKPITIKGTLDGGSADDSQPQISVKLDLDQGTVTTPVGRFAGSSFKGSFINEWVRGQKREDENSAIRLFSFIGDWENIGLKADTITILNLKHPQLACTVHSSFSLLKLNDISGSNSIRFEKGSCKLDLGYKGPLSQKDSNPVSIMGNIDLDTASFTYLPFGLPLTHCSGRVRFSGQDFHIDRLEAHTGNSSIHMQGIAKNLVTLINNNDPSAISMDWSVVSPRLDLGDFIALAGRRVEPSRTSKNSSPFSAVSDRVDRFLKEGTAHMQIEAADLNYRKFSGAHAKADLVTKDGEIKLNKIRIDQESGSLTLSGSLKRAKTGARNPVDLQSHLEQVNLPKLFTAFNNFGQKGLLDKNLRGKLTADIRMKGSLTDKAEVVPGSLKGTISFSIKGGQLVNFEPMEKIQEAVFRNRDFSDIRFAELKNQLDLDGNVLTIHRMEIESTAFTLFVEGIYDWNKGPDLGLQVPLSNLKRRDQHVSPSNKGLDKPKGININLRARTGDDGKLNISWDPFKKARLKRS